MKVKELIEHLQKLPPDTEVWVDSSTTFDDHHMMTRIVKGNARRGIDGGHFERTKGPLFTAIEFI